jgi:NAD(P)-dependent dehydrogenase (short-subunit alcohol dehydrogenase family)
MREPNIKVALVTGASSGIGEAIAARLAEAGYRVFGTSRRAAAGDDSVILDVTSDESVRAAVETVVSRAGRIDLLVNNAGFGVAPAAAEESSIEQAKAIFDTNFFGIVRMTRAVLPQMRAQGSGRIINIGSVLGFLPMPYMALYAATKHAIEGYSESVDHEVRTRGIRVSVVEPAYTKTPFDAHLVEPDATLAAYGDARARVTRRVGEVMATAESPRVVAEVVLRVASAAHPKVRYTAGSLASRLRFMRTVLPTPMMDTGLRGVLGLDTPVRACRRSWSPGTAPGCRCSSPRSPNPSSAITTSSSTSTPRRSTCSTRRSVAENSS